MWGTQTSSLDGGTAPGVGHPGRWWPDELAVSQAWCGKCGPELGLGLDPPLDHEQTRLRHLRILAGRMPPQCQCACESCRYRVHLDHDTPRLRQQRFAEDCAAAERMWSSSPSLMRMEHGVVGNPSCVGIRQQRAGVCQHHHSRHAQHLHWGA